MFAKTQNTVSMILGAVLFAGVAFEAPAHAGEAALAQNEQAAEAAIVGFSQPSAALADASSATLVRNETLAQRAIVDVSATSSVPVAAIGETKLAQNELAAQHAIADTAVAATSMRYAGATASVVATRSPKTH